MDFPRYLRLLIKYAFPVIILGLLSVYLYAAFFKRELGIVRYDKEFTAATLFCLVTLGLNQVYDLAHNRRRLDEAERSLARLAAAAAPSPIEASTYTGDEVYEATRKAIAEAQKQVWVTWLRDEGPDQRKATAKHFDACRKWARRGDRSFRRIVLHSERPEMTEFYRTEINEVAQALQDGYRYQVKLLRGSVHATEVFSVGIYDDVVFFSHRGVQDKAIGVSVRCPELAANMRAYYERLWFLPSACDIGDVFTA